MRNLLHYLSPPYGLGAPTNSYSLTLVPVLRSPPRHAPYNTSSECILVHHSRFVCILGFLQTSIRALTFTPSLWLSCVGGSLPLSAGRDGSSQIVLFIPRFLHILGAKVRDAALRPRSPCHACRERVLREQYPKNGPGEGRGDKQEEVELQLAKA